MRHARSDYLIDGTIYFCLIVMTFMMLYPFWNSFVISLNAGADTAKGGITFWPRVFTLENYRYVFKDNGLVQAFMVTVSRTLVGTLMSIILTSMFGYAMSKKYLMGRNFFMIACVITMYFHGGLIPTYLLVRELHLMNTFWSMIIPGLISVWNMIIFRTFFQQLPKGLEESAHMDGCNHITVFYRIVVPVSGPVIATLSLFTAVYHWNAWFDASIYITNPKLMPLQTLLTTIINSMLMPQSELASAAEQELMDMSMVTHKSIVMSTMMVSTIPIMLVYPFLQRFFVKGVLIGSLKE